MQEKFMTLAQYQAEWNKALLEEKKKNNVDISNFHVLSESFFVGLPSCSNKAPHATNIIKAKATSTLKKKVQPKSSKIPITSIAKEEHQTMQPPKQS